MCLIFCKKYEDTKLVKLINQQDLTDTECCICLELFKEKDKISILPCYHFFHKECILKWIKKNNYIMKCPYCN